MAVTFLCDCGKLAFSAYQHEMYGRTDEPCVTGKLLVEEKKKIIEPG